MQTINVLKQNNLNDKIKTCTLFEFIINWTKSNPLDKIEQLILHFGQKKFRF